MGTVIYLADYRRGSGIVPRPVQGMQIGGTGPQNALQRLVAKYGEVTSLLTTEFQNFEFAADELELAVERLDRLQTRLQESMRICKDCRDAIDSGDVAMMEQMRDAMRRHLAESA
jgi:exonuclease VII small subunit